MIYRVLKSSIRYRLQPTNELQKAKQNLTTPVGCYLAINVKPRQASLQRSHGQKKLPHSFSDAAAKGNFYKGVLSFEQCLLVFQYCTEGEIKYIPFSAYLDSLRDPRAKGAPCGGPHVFAFSQITNIQST